MLDLLSEMMRHDVFSAGVCFLPTIWSNLKDHVVTKQ